MSRDGSVDRAAEPQPSDQAARRLTDRKGAALVVTLLLFAALLFAMTLVRLAS